MTLSQLDRDIAHIKANIKKWHLLYDAEDLARVKRLLSYLEELKALKR